MRRMFQGFESGDTRTYFYSGPSFNIPGAACPPISTLFELRYETDSLLAAVYWLQGDTSGFPMKGYGWCALGLRVIVPLVREALIKWRAKLSACHRPQPPQFGGRTVVSYHEHAYDLAYERMLWLFNQVPLSVQRELATLDYDGQIDRLEEILNPADRGEKLRWPFAEVDCWELSELVALESSWTESAEPTLMPNAPPQMPAEVLLDQGGSEDPLDELA